MQRERGCALALPRGRTRRDAGRAPQLSGAARTRTLLPLTGAFEVGDPLAQASLKCKTVAVPNSH